MGPSRHESGQRGFTLLELLVTVAILGVLSGVAVFGVGALTNNAQGAVCDIEARTIAVAQEAHKARSGAYADLDAILGAGLLSERPELHDVQLVPGGWQLVALGACAGGAVGLAGVGQGASDGADAGGDVVEEHVGVGEDVPSVDSPLQRRRESGRRLVELPGATRPG